MKVRVKLGASSRIVNFADRDGSSVTLEELREAVRSQFDLEIEDFQLSLNKQDALAGNDQPLADFGIVSGDLLHITGSNLSQVSPATNREQAQNRAQPLASYAPAYSNGHASAPHGSSSVGIVSASESAMSTNEVTVARTVESDMDVSEPVQANRGHSSGDVDYDVNRYLQEPLVVRESTASQVPVLLNQLYTSANGASAHDALWVALHTLMLESGFLPAGLSDPTIMPVNWKQPGFYTCTYDFMVSSETTKSCSLVGVTVGASLAVHGLSKSDSQFKTDHLQLRTGDYVRILSQDVSDVYRALDKLSRMFKDSICLPLINEVVTEAGFPQRQGLLAMPYETKLRLMSFLDAKSLCALGQVCQELNAIYKDRTVWRILYIRAFGRPEDCSLSKDWYELFKVKYLQFLEEQEQRRRILYLEETDPFRLFPGPGPFRPFPHGMPFPHLLGGDYDLNPEFVGGIPDPMGAGRRQPGPLLPTVPTPDVDRFGLPARPRRNPGGMAGSPFSSGFRSPFSSGFRGPFI